MLGHGFWIWKPTYPDWESADSPADRPLPPKAIVGKEIKSFVFPIAKIIVGKVRVGPIAKGSRPTCPT